MEAFEHGRQEVSEVVAIDGQDHMRLMRPFRIDPSCLTCHEEQGYKVGDIRGGISVSVPMRPIMASASHTWSLILGHLVLWMLGVAGIVLSGRQIGVSAAAALQAQEAAAAATMAVQTVDGMLDGVIITDLRGRITHTNKALTDYFGWGRDVLGELATSLVADRDGPRLLKGLAACLEQGYERDLECSLLTKDRHEVPVLINASLITDPQGQPLGVIGVIRDMTTLRRAETALEAERRRLLSLLEELPAYVNLKAPDYSIKFANRFFRERFGDPGGRPCYQVIRGYDAPCEDCQVMTVLDTHEPQEREWTHRDGRTYHAYDYPFPDSDGTPLVLELGIDVTDRKQAEEEIRQLNEELEQRVKTRTAQLEVANRELESFSYSVSHDLRGPLRAIDGFSRILLKDYCPGPGCRRPTVFGYHPDQHPENGPAHRRPPGLLALGPAGVEGGRPGHGNPGPGRGGRTARRSRRPDGAVGPQAPLRGPGRPGLDAPGLGQSPGQCPQFTPSQETAVIEVGSRSDGDEDIYYVKDNGVGFDMQYAPKLFGVFQRLHREEEFEGTGVGLALVQRIVQRHGGRVWAEGQVGRGATFYFSLPRRQAGQAAS